MDTHTFRFPFKARLSGQSAFAPFHQGEAPRSPGQGGDTFTATNTSVAKTDGTGVPNAQVECSPPHRHLPGQVLPEPSTAPGLAVPLAVSSPIGCQRVSAQVSRRPSPASSSPQSWLLHDTPDSRALTPPWLPLGSGPYLCAVGQASLLWEPRHSCEPPRLPFYSC
jgi:hypothetical protein